MVDSVFETVDLEEIAAQAGQHVTELLHSPNLSQDIRDIIDSHALTGMLRQLDRHDVQTLDLPAGSDSPEGWLRNLLLEGADTMKREGVPQPHLDDYANAELIARDTGRAFPDVLSLFQAARPEEVGVPESDGSPISITPAQDGDGITINININLGGGPVMETAPEPEPVPEVPDVEPQTYQDYDVHLMSYPIDATFGAASHSFVVAVPKGTDISDPDALREGIQSGETPGLVTRAGADGPLWIPNFVAGLPERFGGIFGSIGGGILGKFSGIFATPVFKEVLGFVADIFGLTAPDGRRQEGDVYVADGTESLADLEEDGITVMKSGTVSVGSFEELQATVNNFREQTNAADIDYDPLGKNSNTYAGDIFEKLTGEEPERGGARLTPGLTLDLQDYEATEHAPDFS